MSFTYYKEKNAEICLQQLESDIKNSVIIEKILVLLILEDSFNIEITFDEELSSVEEAELDSIIADHECNIEENDSDSFDDLVTVQLINSESIEINPTTYQTIPVPTLSIENNTTIIEHDGDINGGIKINESGLYAIVLNGYIETDIVLVNSKVIILRPGIGEIDITESVSSKKYSQALPWQRLGYNSQYANTNMNININYNLQKDDVVYIQMYKSLIPDLGGHSHYGKYFPSTDSETYAKILKNLIFQVTKLNGPIGPEGRPGIPGVTKLDIMKQGAIKASDINQLNFTGNVTVTNDGNNKATISITNGSNQFALHQIIGDDGQASEPMAFLVDPTRNDRLLSIESTCFTYSENYLSDNDWVQIGQISNSNARCIMPYDGVITRATISLSNTPQYETDIKLYVNETEYDLLTLYDDDNKKTNVCVDIRFNKGDSIKARCVMTRDGNSLRNAALNIWSKWEMRN